ncbi:MAG: metal-sensing transcriptional repressor [Stenotrophobium sp.]
MSHPNAHIANPGIIKRLRRAIGQLNTVVDMIEEHRSCTDVAMQLQAAEKAIAQAKKTFIHQHIDNCLEPGETVSKQSMQDLKDISKYL